MPVKISVKRLNEISQLPDNALITIPEAAAFDNISLSSAYRRVRNGHWSVIKIVGTTRITYGTVLRARNPCGEQ